jgi:hypothetical protein
VRRYNNNVKKKLEKEKVQRACWTFEWHLGVHWDRTIFYTLISSSLPVEWYVLQTHTHTHSQTLSMIL